MPKKNNKRRFVNPFNKQYGWRTGIDILAGKNIRKDAEGYEDFRDYLSESEAETTSELSRLEDVSQMKENRNSRLRRPRVAVKGPSLSQPCAHSTAYSSMCSQTSRGGALSQIYNGDTLGISSITNSQISEINPGGWLRNRNIGRRTGKDITEGKVIRKDEEGYEMFEDYLSESEAESLSSSGMTSRLSRTSNFTREPSKLTEDHTNYEENLSMSTEDSGSAEVTKDQSLLNKTSGVQSSQEEDTPTFTRTQSIAANTESYVSEEEKTPQADRSSTAVSNPRDKSGQSTQEETSVFTDETQTQSQGTPLHSAGSPSPMNNHQSVVQSEEDTSSQNGVEDPTSNPEVTKVSHMDIGGNKTGSITKSEDFSNSVVPSFRTRKRISFSAREFNSTRRESKATTEDQSEASVTSHPVCESDTDSLEIIIVAEQDQKPKGRKSNQTESSSSLQRSSIAEATMAPSQGRRSLKSIEDKNSSLSGRTRISFSAREFNSTRRESKATTEDQSEASVTSHPVCESDTDSLEIIIVAEQDQKPKGRKSNQTESSSSLQRSSIAEATMAPSQGRRSLKSIEDKNSSLSGRTRGKRGKSLSTILPLETSKNDSSQKTTSRKSRGRSISEGSRYKEPRPSEQGNTAEPTSQLDDERQGHSQEDDEIMSNASQEFLFFRERGAEVNQTKQSKSPETKATKATQKKRKQSLLAKSLGEKDTASDVNADDSIDPNIEIEKWRNGKPKVGGKRKKASETSNKDDGNVVTAEPPSHSPPKKSKGKKNRKDSNAGRRSSRGQTKSADGDNPKPSVNNSLTDKEETREQAEDRLTQEEEVYSDIEASELVMEEEVTRGTNTARERKSSVTKESVQLGDSGTPQKSHSVTADNSEKVSDINMKDSAGNSFHEKDLDKEEIVDTAKNRRDSSETHQSSFLGPKSTPLSTGQNLTGKNQKARSAKSRKSSADTSHVSEIRGSEDDEVIIPKTNASIHSSRYITSFLSDDHEKQGLDNRSMSSRSKSLGSRTRKAKTRNDSMQRKMNSAQKSNKFQSKSFSNGTGRKDRTSLVNADTSKRKSMKKSRSLHSAFIGTMENLPGTEGKEELSQDLGFNDVNDVNPNDLYVEREKEHTRKSQRKGQKHQQVEKGKSKKTRTKGRKRKDESVENLVENSIGIDSVENIQNDHDVDDHQTEEPEDENLSVEKKRGQKKAKSLGLINSGRRKEKSTKLLKSESLGGLLDNASEEDVNMGKKDPVEERAEQSGNVNDLGSGDEPEELAQDKVPEENMSSRKHVMTPVSMYQADEDLVKSGVSFRYRNRTLIKNSTLNITTADKTPVAVKKHMNFMDSPEGLTPILKQPGSVKRGKQQRVTINNLVQEQSYQTEEQQRLSMSAGSLSSMSLNSTPVHIFQTTTSESPVPQMLVPPQPKIFLPEDAPDGLRRSQRVRCQPVAWYKGERVLYKRRKSGLCIQEVVPSHVEMLMLAQEAKRKKNLIKRRQNDKRLKVSPSPRRNLSVHTTLDPELQDGSDSEVPVLNPGTNEEVLMDCFSSKDSEVFVGPSKHDPISSDPYVMSLRLNQKQFMMGNLYLRPLKRKPEQVVNKGSMVFCLLKGKISVTIHRTKMIAEAGDMFFIPQGNTYSMENLRREEARLTFSCHKFSVDSDLSSASD